MKNGGRFFMEMQKGFRDKGRWGREEKGKQKRLLQHVYAPIPQTGYNYYVLQLKHLLLKEFKIQTEEKKRKTMNFL